MNPDLPEIFNKTRALSDEIKNTALYRKYISARERTKNDPELAARINEYKQLHAEYCVNPGELLFDEEKRISGIFWALMLNDNARELFESERDLIEIYRSVVDIILESSGIEITEEVYNAASKEKTG